MFTKGWHGFAHSNPRRGGDDAEADMHQASILFTAAVLAMAGAWYVMQDMKRADARAAEQSAVAVAQAEPLAE
jgi:hypothetical protein